jgi:NAD+ kinase
MTIAVFGLKVNKEDLDYTYTLIDALSRDSVRLLIHEQYAEQLIANGVSLPPHHRYSDHLSLLSLRPSIMISMGGDGTILRSKQLVRDSLLPIMGINLGRMGFLASIEKQRIRKAIDEVIAGKYYTEDRTMIHLESNIPIFDKEEVYALNDFTLHKRDTSSMITIKSYIDGNLFNTYWADGIIVATPTGSTGYSLACGGPIVFPDSGNFIITPVAPHNLNVRPVVISDDTTISFSIEGRSENFLCTLDNQYATITTEHHITLRKADHKIRLAHMHDITFMRQINEKLLWGLDIRN